MPNPLTDPEFWAQDIAPRLTPRWGDVQRGVINPLIGLPADVASGLYEMYRGSHPDAPAIDSPYTTEDLNQRMERAGVVQPRTEGSLPREALLGMANPGKFVGAGLGMVEGARALARNKEAARQAGELLRKAWGDPTKFRNAELETGYSMRPRGDVFRVMDLENLRLASNPPNAGPLAQHVTFPELFQAYPHMAEMPTQYRPIERYDALFTPQDNGLGEIDISHTLPRRSIARAVSHEGTHAIDHFEGNGYRSYADQHAADLGDMLHKLQNTPDDVTAFKDLSKKERGEVAAWLKSEKERVSKISQYDYYRRSVSEQLPYAIEQQFYGINRGGPISDNYSVPLSNQEFSPTASQVTNMLFNRSHQMY